MLIDFTVKNFRSFGEEQTLSMIASKKLQDHPTHCVPIAETGESALQTAVIYGANASGKSNLVKALHFLQMLIVRFSNAPVLPLNQFRFQSETRPTEFTLRFLVDDYLFTFTVRLTGTEVLDESLLVLTSTGREHSIYSRQLDKIKIGPLGSLKTDGEASRKALTALELLGLRPKQLLLSKILDLTTAHRGPLLDRVVRWFTDMLCVVEPDDSYHALIELIKDDNAFRSFSGAFLKNAATGIEELQVNRSEIPVEQVPKPLLENLQSSDGEEIKIRLGNPAMSFEIDPTDPTKVIRHNLVSRHRIASQYYGMRFEDESDGTQRCLHLLPAIYDASKNSRVFVIDELDRSLHPLLAHSLLKLFTESAPSEPRQMIVTTHETHLLDQDILRRDEVIFVEKDRTQQSRLTSLADFNIRNDLKLEKGYLQGRFGGIPFIGDTKKLLDMLRPEATGKPNGKSKKKAARTSSGRRS
jgi:uncharacterized protein